MPPASNAEQPISEWSEDVVANWLAQSLGLGQYEHNMKEHRIAGDVLCKLDLDLLKEIGIASIGQRLHILRAVYQLKVAHNEPIEEGDYIPPSELDERPPVTVEKLGDIVRDQADRLIALEQENRRIHTRLQVCLEELNIMGPGPRRSDEERDARQQPSSNWAFGKSTRSPTKPIHDDESPHASPLKPEHDIPPPRYLERPQAPSRGLSSSSTAISSPNGSTPVSRGSPANLRGDLSSADSLKSFKVALEDPTWRVLPAALKKYKIKDEDWRNYAMFICYGNTDRCLSYDEKPLLLFQKLKEARKNPVFMLKHIKDIRSPIAQAQQKQQARLQARTENGNTLTGNSARTSAHPSVRAATMGSRMTNIGTPPLGTANSMQPQWPEIMSPVVESRQEEGGRSRLLNQSIDDESNLEKISYAVAIYPYLAEQDDEFDVAVGDTFVILSRAKGWWVVQRDPGGTGNVDLDVIKQAWVPAGCLLETAYPIPSQGASNSARVQIPHASIVSTSYPGIALMDYQRKAEDELDLQPDDLLRVFKKYNHWSYVVKEDSGERGWVPSWFIGKTVPSAGVPPTPSSMASTLQGNSSITNAPITFAGSDAGAGNSPLNNHFSFAGRSNTGGL